VEPVFPAQQRTPIFAIEVGKRRREDMGDIDGLAESIKKHGLLHPIIIDEHRRLVAGGRRLEACKRLGWEYVPTRMLGELTEAELREIELEENLRRKDLTEYERSKKMLELAEVAAEILKSEPEFSPSVGKNTSPGRPPKPDSQQRVAERIGVPQQTLSDAKRHVEAVDKYPELKTFPKSDAIKAAKTLDSMPEPVRQETREKIRQLDPNTVAMVAGKPPMPKVESVEQQRKKDPEWWFRKATHDLWATINSMKYHGGIDSFVHKLGVDERRYAIENIDALIAELSGWKKAIESQALVRRVK